MQGRPCELFVDPKARPFAIHKHRPVVIHWEEQTRQGLERDVNMGVIRPKLVGDPTLWCVPMHLVAKKSGKLRRYCNARACRPCRALHSTKTTLDSWNGYHSVPLREEDRHLTTFLTPWGKYEYCNLPQGQMVAGDTYTARYDEIAHGFERMERWVDETILWDFR